jgi:hypothetical protein
MTLTAGIRLWFLVLYLAGSTAFLAAAIRFRARRDAIEKKKGPLPAPGMLLAMGVPLLVLLTQVGEIPADWLLLRFIGLGLSFYA